MHEATNRLAWAIASGGINTRNLNSIAVDLIAQKSMTANCEILDAGCGAGELGQLIHQRLGIIADGVDIANHGLALQRYRKFLIWDLDHLPDPTHQYDVICSVEVIEHLQCPRDFVRRLSAWLKPGGRLLISTPNVASLVSIMTLLTQGHYREFRDGVGMYPAHISPVLPSDLARIMGEAGLNVEQVIYSGQGRMPFAHRNWPPSVVSIKPSMFSDNYFAVASRP